MSEKITFGSKIGLIAATVGSAVGLGNIWRFPSEVQANGGAAFVIIYLICVFLLGIPVMLAEFSLGRGAQSDPPGVYKKLTRDSKWWLNGVLAVVASFFIMSFYMVVAGWTLEYLFQSITGSLYEGYTAMSGQGESFFVAHMKENIATGWKPLIWTYILIALNLGILLRGVQKGIEKMSNILMPILFVLLLVFCGVSLSLPNAWEGVKYFLNPNFEVVNFSTIINALGQAFFSLSLGMGILITYAAYYPANTKLTRTAVTVAVLDFAVAFLMGLIIFPGVKSFGLDADPSNLAGTTLVFVTLPEMFANMGATSLWSILFFLLLSVAAITSTISIAEVTVFSIQKRFNLSRKKACAATLLPLFITSGVCALSQGVLSDFTIAGMNFFDLLDTVATNFMLPIGSIFLCIYVGWVLPSSFLKKELTNDGTMKSKAFPFVIVLIKYVAPILIGLILVSKIIEVI